MNDLNAVIENLYAAFGSVPKPVEVEGCPCCTQPDELRALTATPLRSLTESELDRYAQKALTTIGTEQDLLYFAPRILELHVQNDMLSHTEITLGKLRQCPLNVEQWDAVADFLLSWWTTLLQTENGWKLEEILASAQCFGMSWTPFLQIWDEADSLSATVQLSRLIDQCGYSGWKVREFNAFLSKSAQAELDALKCWLKRDAIKQRLEQAFFVTIDEKNAKIISDALIYVEAMP